MPRIKSVLFAAAAGVGLTAGSALAAECTTDVAEKEDIKEAEIVALYDCIAGAMAGAYAKSEHPAAADFRSWTVTGTRPGLAGAHSERFLLTWANPAGAEEYLKFAEEGVVMPVGSVLAKESFNVKNGKAVVGPLFLMTKVGADQAPDTGGWFYEAVQPNGKMMKFPQAMCHDCHIAWESQDALAYPLEEVRVGAAD